jgi:hypothetical protein
MGLRVLYKKTLSDPPFFLTPLFVDIKSPGRLPLHADKRHFLFCRDAKIPSATGLYDVAMADAAGFVGTTRWTQPLPQRDIR